MNKFYAAAMMITMGAMAAMGTGCASADTGEGEVTLELGDSNSNLVARRCFGDELVKGGGLPGECAAPPVCPKGQQAVWIGPNDNGRYVCQPIPVGPAPAPAQAAQAAPAARAAN